MDAPEPASFVMISKLGYSAKEVAVSMKARENGTSSVTNQFWKPIYYMINVSLAIIITAMRDGGESLWD